MSDFSVHGYRRFLELARSFGFVSVQPGQIPEETKRGLLLRHDVDFDPQPCLDMGALDAEHGFSSVFLFSIDSDFYSVFDERSLATISNLQNLGHIVGMHWDRSKLPLRDTEALESLRLRKSMFEDLIQTEIKYGSQHMPTSNVSLPGITNIFEVELYNSEVMKSFFYISDSSMRWRSQSIYEVLESKNFIHFLAHPLWWMNPGRDSLKKLQVSKERAHSNVEKKYEIFIQVMEDVLALGSQVDEKTSTRIHKSN